MVALKRYTAAVLCVFLIMTLFFCLPAFAGSKISVTIEDYVNIRNLPTTQGSTVLFQTSSYVSAISDGTEKDSSGKKWYHVILPNGITGYACGDYVTENGTITEDGGETETPAEEYFESYFTGNKNLVMISGSGVNLREGPSTSYSAICQTWSCVMENLGKTVNGYGSTWYKVKTPGGIIGYIYSDYVREYTYTVDAEFEKTLSAFPSSYRNGLRYLHTLYPNWKFYADNIQSTLENAAKAQAGRKLLSNYYKNYLPDSWRTSSGVTTLESGYSYASKLAISYAMNPENFITEVSIFMFMQHSYDPLTQNKTTVKKIVAGTFLDREDYINYLISAAEQSNVNPDILAGIILQEQGSSGSALSLGTYEGYEGYYNFYNFSASGSTTEEIIKNGLEYAKKKGWNTPEKAIVEGAKLYGENYVNSNQYTHYYKDYNVIDGVIWHQYATNLFDHISNAAKVYEGYKERSSSVSFRIPVFISQPNTHTHSWSGIEYDSSSHYKRCTGCGELKEVEAHTFGAWQRTSTQTSEGRKFFRVCSVCGCYEEMFVQTGVKNPDLNNDGVIDDSDAVYLLFFTFFPDDYPINDDCDYNSDGVIDDKDAVYLLFYTFFPGDYPIQ